MHPFADAEVLTFDCYGTIIDWETGILAAMTPLLAAHDVAPPTHEILRLYAGFEAEVESGAYKRYADVLREVVRRFAAHYRFELASGEEETLVASLPKWPAFADSAGALNRLHEQFELAILSNVDDDLFAQTQNALGVKFDWIVTAQQVRSYKPAPGHWERILELTGRPKETLVHCGQSPYHDIAPARALGIRSVWVRRRGFGATLPAEAAPDLTVTTLGELADALLA